MTMQWVNVYDQSRSRVIVCFRGVRIPKFWVRIRPRILTKDPRLCPQDYAILDPLLDRVRDV